MFLKKSELKERLQSLGVRIENGRVRKSDIERIIFEGEARLILAGSDNFISDLKGGDAYISNDVLGFDREDDIFIRKVAFEWSYDLEVRSYGIKSLAPIVPDQEILVAGSVTHSDDSEEEFEKQVKAANIKVEIERKEEGGVSLYPSEIEINAKGCRIVFNV